MNIVYNKNTKSCALCAPRGISNVRNSQFVWCTEYADDILHTMLQAEKNRKTVQFKLIDYSDRIVLISLIKNTSQRLQIARTTVHLGIFLLDCMLDHYTISNRSSSVVALICLLLACKVDECDRKIPRIRDLLEFLPGIYKVEEFLLVECLILKFFDWHIILPTAATFIESLAHHVVTQNDFKNYCKMYETHEIMCSTSQSIVYDYLDATLYDRRFVCQKPSLIAAACLAATRKVMGIEPVWPTFLEETTCCNANLVMEYANALITLKHCWSNKYDNMFSSPDSGYKSTDSESLEGSTSPKKRRIY